MAKAYHTLIAFNGDKWGIEFGDYCRETVEDEMESYLDSGEYKKNSLRIIRTSDKQADIDSAVARLNSGIGVK